MSRKSTKTALMTDEELTKLAAQEIMGWRKGKWGSYWSASDGREIHQSLWNPLSQLERAFELLETLRRTDKWCCITINSDYHYVWDVSFTRCTALNEGLKHEPQFQVTEEELPRAITMACLYAVGALEVEREGSASENP